MKYKSALIFLAIALLFLVQSLIFQAPNENAMNTRLVELCAGCFVAACFWSWLATHLRNKLAAWIAQISGILGVVLYAYRVFGVNISDLTDPIVLVGSALVFLLLAVPAAYAIYLLFPRFRRQENF